jgi:hypothetical protein
MKYLNTYLTFISVIFFISVNAQKGMLFYPNHVFSDTKHSPLKTKTKQSTFQNDIFNCQNNIKSCITKCAKIILKNTFYIQKIGYVSEEGIVFKTGKRIKLVLWYSS